MALDPVPTEPNDEPVPTEESKVTLARVMGVMDANMGNVRCRGGR